MSVKKCGGGRKCVVCRKRQATVEARKLWGDGGVLLCCDVCKPDMSKRPESQRHLPFFYEVVALAGAEG